MGCQAPAIDCFALLAQVAAEPQIDGPFVIRVVSRIVHILCAIILGGGLFYLRSILAPAGVEACFAERRSVWARWVGVATALLLVSGMFNYIVNIRDARSAGTELPTTYHALFGIKFILSLGVMFIAAILAGKTAAAERFRADMRKWLNIAWTAVMAIVVLAALMRTYHLRTPERADPLGALSGEAADGQES
jgi:putative copper export protein